FPDLESDPSAEKAVRFFELAFDAFVGDIKNNVVLESKEDGIRNYTVSASEVQIPEVINAGVALFGTYGIFGRNTDYVVTRYEDYDAAKRAYYKQKTGNDLPLDYYDSEKSEEIEKVLEGFYDLEMPYENKNGGVLVVYKDASTKYYSSFAKAMDDPANVNIFNPDDYISRFMGQDAWIKSGTNDFSIDEKGRLVSSDFTIVFATRDTEGVEHEIKVVLNAKFSDYGTTQIEMPDLEGYTKIKETEEKDTVMPFDEDTAKAKPED
ncbi:MAG: hypothetical protein ACTTH0_05900, partial [Eubacteriales bacterium]